MRLINRLVYLRKWRLVREILAIYGVEIPKEVKIGSDFDLVHRGYGTVIHPSTIIGNRVSIYHQVTIGRLDAYRSGKITKMKEVVIGDDVILFPGAKILGGDGVTSLGRGTIVAANAVLTKSTGVGEIWAGVPAKLIGYRDPSTFPAEDL